MNRVLWLASWYPNRMDPFDGDFIERHALAVSRFVKLTLVLVVKDESLKNNSFEIEKTFSQNLKVYKVYYGRSGFGGRLENLLSFRKYIQLQKKIYQLVLKEDGPPEIVHVQVAMKAGMLARWLKQKYSIPFVVTEHWTGYYPESQPNIFSGNPLLRVLNKKILKDADLFLPVSEDLGKTVNQYFTPVSFKVVPNTVDTSLFNFNGPPKLPEKFRFIHPSNLSYQKNPEGILQACKIVKESGYNFELLMIGKKDEQLVLLAKQYGLGEQLTMKAPVPYGSIAEEMRNSSGLLLFSRFENQPCVILEALCCGLPVISSRVGGIQEVINDKNGILVKSENINALATAMMKLIDTNGSYDRVAISENAIGLFNYDTIGKQYSELYQTILNKL